MRNYVSDGNTRDFVNTTGSTILADSPVAVGDMVGVAIDDIPDTETGVLQITGIVRLPKGATTIGDGADVYLTAGNITSTPTGGVSAGQAVGAADTGDSHVNVRLGPTSTPAS